MQGGRKFLVQSARLNRHKKEVMFTDKTIIILGAGASCHLGYPTGEELVDQIKDPVSSKLHTPIELSTLLREMQPLSIDTFLSYHTEFEEIGKELIARAILDKEEKSFLDSKNWYRFLVDALISQCKKSEDILFNLENLMIITFNYDISLEYYLCSRLKKISFFRDKIDEFLHKIRIVHAYGQLGCFSWHKEFCEKTYENAIEERGIETYGNRKKSFKKLSNGIDIIGIRKWNPQTPPKHIKLIHDFLEQVNNVFILGFGFYEENMELINLNKHTFQDRDKVFYYTNFYDMQKIERKILKRNIKKGSSNNFVKSTKKVYDALSQDFELC